MADEADLEVDQGGKFEAEIQVKDENDAPINITGFIFKGQARESYNAEKVLNFAFDIVDAVNGKVNLIISASESSAYTVDSKVNLLYDIEYQTSISEQPRKLLRGKLKLTPEVTKP